MDEAAAFVGRLASSLPPSPPALLHLCLLRRPPCLTSAFVGRLASPLPPSPAALLNLCLLSRPPCFTSASFADRLASSLPPSSAPCFTFATFSGRLASPTHLPPFLSASHIDASASFAGRLASLTSPHRSTARRRPATGLSSEAFTFMTVYCNGIRFCVTWELTVVLISSSYLELLSYESCQVDCVNSFQCHLLNNLVYIELVCRFYVWSNLLEFAFLKTEIVKVIFSRWIWLIRSPIRSRLLASVRVFYGRYSR